MAQPTIQVLLDDASNSGTFPYDITAYVRLVDGIEVTRGRGNEFDEIQAGTLKCTLENTDGRFTLGSTVGSYGGALNTDRRIRYKVTANAVTTTRFTGYVQNWPAEWPDGGDTFAVARITAVDHLARMARKTLRSIIEEEILLDSPSAYYTLGEPAGATTAADTSGNNRAMLTPNGTGITFGSATGPGTDSLTAASLTGASQFTLGSSSFTGLLNGPIGILFPYYAIEFFISTTAVLGSTATIATFVDSQIYMDTSGRVVCGSITGPVINDGKVHHVALTTDVSAVTRLYVDGVLAGTGTASGSVYLTSLTIGPVGFAASLAHVAIYFNTGLNNAARVAAHASAGLTGFAGERSDQRVARIASYAGVAATALESGIDTSVPFVDITGASPLAAANDVEKAEGGVVFIRGDGTLVMQNRSHRALQTTPDLTMSNNEVDPASTVVGDMQLVENVVTVSAGANGAVQTVASATSRTAHGDYPTDLTGLLVSTDELALNAAQWRVGKYAEPFLRVPDLGFDLATLTPAQQASVMALEISDHIQITGMPAQAGSTTLDLLVEGWTETLTADSWDWQANTSNFSTASAWVLGDATYGVLGSTTALGY